MIRVELIEKIGGPGSGNYGHGGRPGQRGGSGEGGSGGGVVSPEERKRLDKVIYDWQWNDKPLNDSDAQKIKAITQEAISKNPKTQGMTQVMLHRAVLAKDADKAPKYSSWTDDKYTAMNMAEEWKGLEGSSKVVSRWIPLNRVVAYPGSFPSLGRPAPGSSEQFGIESEWIIENAMASEKGGSGSGNFGHSGRPGERGGSGEGGSSGGGKVAYSLPKGYGTETLKPDEIAERTKGSMYNKEFTELGEEKYIDLSGNGEEERIYVDALQKEGKDVGYVSYVVTKHFSTDPDGAEQTHAYILNMEATVEGKGHGEMMLNYVQSKSPSGSLFVDAVEGAIPYYKKLGFEYFNEESYENAQTMLRTRETYIERYETGEKIFVSVEKRGGEKMLPAKYRLRASKVDRIAIVDRPAVPDAQILLFKRRKDKKEMDFPKMETEVEKSLVDFVREFMIRSASTAVGVLEEGFWRIAYAEVDAAEKAQEWKTLFEDFRGVIDDVMAGMPESTTEKADDLNEPTVTDMVTSFMRGMKLVAVSESFQYFKNTLGYIVPSIDQIPNGSELVAQMIDAFEEHLTVLVQGAFEKKDGQVSVEKVGRAISTARLAKLKSALRTLAEIVDEGETYLDKSRKEEDQMDIKDILKVLNESELLKGIQTQLVEITTALKSQGLLLTPEEKAKKEADEKVKVEADEKAKKEQDEVAKKAKAEADEKAKKDAEEAEKKAKDLEEEKKKKESEAQARLEKIEKGLETVAKVTGEVTKRLGIKTSLDVDGAGKRSGDRDVFGDAVKGAK